MMTAMSETALLTPETLLKHWEGHRRLTRRTIEAFPADQLFSFTPAPPMRAFGILMLEVIQMLEPTLAGLQTGQWMSMEESMSPTKLAGVNTKEALLETWDKTDALLSEVWPRIPGERFHAVESPFGLPPMPNIGLVLYLIENEVHHRAQGYVYLRLLGIEPPAFYER